MAIALRHDVDWQELLRVNGLNEASILQPGQILQLP
jgi:LysM repeat protein